MFSVIFPVFPFRMVKLFGLANCRILACWACTYILNETKINASFNNFSVYVQWFKKNCHTTVCRVNGSWSSKDVELWSVLSRSHCYCNVIDYFPLIRLRKYFKKLFFNQTARKPVHFFHVNSLHSLRVYLLHSDWYSNFNLSLYIF